ncbi:Tetratricopeptide-like helical [Plasmopara halstedii]|uniref:Tetratricopeptide-like helical n=1 Tax=Plasmopara halstedii TaxID=4781 RepID=A0A0P1ARA3_PLAHL|nr:Tetratricopeptide-like helical [Plasmopara halstedii]CEG43909.1 Tetratricopeptide-like helical [Plasmopara halstedii]|eukprot:XP_024580278.1 Tetratricopeptide-like helical [Plasmopara halstedii]
MRLELSSGEVVFCICSISLALYMSPFFYPSINTNVSNAWDFLLVWDDKENFLDNEVIQSGLSLSNLYAMFTMTKINVYEPFGWLLKAIQVQYFGLDPWWIRIVSAVIHVMGAVILARVSAVLLDIITLLSMINSSSNTHKERLQHQTKIHWLGCCISATLYAFHPVHVEVIGWPSAQPYALCALFSNLALYVYVRATHNRLKIAHQGIKNVKAELLTCLLIDRGWSDLVYCGCYLSALLSKSACILLPVSCFLIDVLVCATLYPQVPRPTFKQWCLYFRRKVPVITILLFFITLTFASNFNGMHPEADLISLTLVERVIKATSMPVWILRLLLWPSKLRPHYQLRPEDLSLANQDCLLSLSASAAILLYTVWLIQHHQTLQHLLALIYFITMVLPVSGFIQHGMVSAGCNRYAYLCGIILVPYGGAMLARLFDYEISNDEEPEHSQTRPKQSRSKRDRILGLIVVFLLSGTFSTISISLMGVWRNEDALLEYSLRMDPTDWRILDQRATYLVTSGRYSSSENECRRLWELAYFYTPMGTLKADLFRLKIKIWLNGMDNDVCEGYMTLLKAHPDNCHVHNNVGVCLTDQGKISLARQEFEQALQCSGYEQLYKVPRKNLARLIEWENLKEKAQADGEEIVPEIKSQIMF